MEVLNVVGYDSGFDYDKIVIKEGEEGKVKFPAVTYKPSKQSLNVSNSSTVNSTIDVKTNYTKGNMSIVYNGAEYYVGKKAIQQGGKSVTRKFEDDKFKTDFEKIKLLSGLETLYKQESNLNKIKLLVVGLNIGAYNDLKEDYENEFKGKKFEYKINGRDKVLEIENCICLPQGLGNYYDCLFDMKGIVTDKKLANSYYGLLDFGGKTVDYFLANGNDIIRDGVGSLNDKGTTSVFKAVADEKGIPGYKVETAYIKGEDQVFHNEFIDIKEDCERGFENLANSVYDEVSIDWNKFMSNIHFIMIAGGGAKEVGSTLTNSFDKKVITIEDAQFSNSRGFYKLGKLMMRKQNR